MAAGIYILTVKMTEHILKGGKRSATNGLSRSPVRNNVQPWAGDLSSTDGLIPLETAAEGRFQSGQNGVCRIYATGDRKAELILFDTHTLVWG